MGPTNPFIAFEKEEVEQSIPARFEQQVAKYSDHVALRTETLQFRYSELNRAANRLAHAILEQRGGQEEPIAFLLDGAVNQIVAFLGILKAGKAVVPLDVHVTGPRTSAMVEEARPGLIVTDESSRKQASALSRQSCPLLLLEETDSRSGENPGLRLAPERLACIFCTSGTTGKPKGVVHSHRNVLHYTRKYTNLFHIGDQDRMTLIASMSFATATSDLFGCLLNGATLLPFDVKKDGLVSLAGRLRDFGATLYHSAPTLFRHFVSTLPEAESLPGLRLIRLGGESVTRQEVDLYQKHFGSNCLLVVTLGATEFPGICACFLDKETSLTSARVPVGSPRVLAHSSLASAGPPSVSLASGEVLVLSETGDEVRAGEVGEIAVRSAYLALGYWAQPGTDSVRLPPRSR